MITRTHEETCECGTSDGTVSDGMCGHCADLAYGCSAAACGQCADCTDADVVQL